MTPITPWQCLHRIARRNRGWVKEALDGAAAGAINKASTSACVGTAGATRAGDKDAFKPNILHFLEGNLAHRVLRDHPSEKGLKNPMVALRHRNKLRSVFCFICNRAVTVGSASLQWQFCSGGCCNGERAREQLSDLQTWLSETSAMLCEDRIKNSGGPLNSQRC